jgi:hypothetical protein
MEIWCTVRYERLRVLVSYRFRLLEQWSNVSRILCIGYLLGDPETCLVVHEGVEVLHVAFDFQE